MSHENYIAALRRFNENKCAVLTVFLISFWIAASLFDEETPWFQALLSFYYLIVVIAPYLITGNRKWIWPSAIAGVIMLSPRLFLLLNIDPRLNRQLLHSPLLSIMLVGAEFALTLAVAAYISVDTRPEGPIFGCILAYLLLGVTFGDLYFLLNRLLPNSFATADLTHYHPSWFDLQYFSLATLTTTGYGDILPLSRPARILAMLQSCLGVLYVGVFAGKLMGRARQHQPEPSRKDQV